MSPKVGGRFRRIPLELHRLNLVVKALTNKRTRKSLGQEPRGRSQQGLPSAE